MVRCTLLLIQKQKFSCSDETANGLHVYLGTTWVFFKNIFSFVKYSTMYHHPHGPYLLFHNLSFYTFLKQDLFMFLRIHMFSELRIPHKLSFVAAISDRVQFSNNCCNKLERYMGHISISTLCLFHNFLSWKCGYKMHLNISVFEQTLPSWNTMSADIQLKS